MKHLLGERLQEKTPAAVSYTCSATQGEALVSPKSSEGSGAPLPRRVHTARRPRSSPPAPACAPPPLPRPSAAAAPLVETSAPAPLDPSAPPPLEATRPRSAPPTRRSSRLAARAGAQGPAASGEVPALAHHGALAGRRGREIRCRPCRIRSSEEWIHAGEVPPCRSRSVSPAPPPPFHPRGEEKSGRQPPSRASLRRVRPAQGAALALPLRRRRDAILEKAAVRSRGQKRRRRRASLDAASSTASSTPRSTARSSLRPAQLSMDPNQPNDGSQGGFPGGNNPHYHQGWNPYMYGYQHPPSWPPQGYMPINPNASMMRPTPPVFDPAENATAAMEKDDKDCEEIPASSVPKGKEKRTKVPRIKLSNFSPEEDKNLVMSWLEISNDPIKANAQRKEGYWLNILHRYNLRRGSYPERTIKSLQSRWDTTCGVLHNIYLNKQRIKFRETC